MCCVRHRRQRGTACFNLLSGQSTEGHETATGKRPASRRNRKDRGLSTLNEENNGVRCGRQPKPELSVFKGLRQEDRASRASLSYIVRSCLNKHSWMNKWMQQNKEKWKSGAETGRGQKWTGDKMGISVWYALQALTLWYALITNTSWAWWPSSNPSSPEAEVGRSLSLRLARAT